MFLEAFSLRLLTAFAKFIHYPVDEVATAINAFMYPLTVHENTIKNYYNQITCKDDIVPIFQHRGKSFNMDLAKQLQRDLVANPSLSTYRAIGIKLLI